MRLAALRTLLLCALPAPVAAQAAAPGEEGPPIAFAPAEGLGLRKTFTRELRLSLDRAGSGGSLFRPGEPGTWRDWQEVVLTDVYGAVVDGLPARLERTYEKARMEHEHGVTIDVPAMFGIRVHVPRSGRGSLEGRTVLFTREEGARAATCAPADGGELDDDALAALEEDADLRELLPWEEEDLGDSWFTGVDAFRQLGWPGGAMAFLDDHGHPLVKPVDQVAVRDLGGTFRVELVDVREVRGRRLARLALRCVLEAETRFEHDLSVTGLGWTGYFPDRLEFPVRQQLGLYVVATGTAEWDVAGGHLASLHLEGRVEVDQLARAGMPDSPAFLDPEAFEWRARWSGTLEATVDVERLHEPLLRTAGR